LKNAIDLSESEEEEEMEDLIEDFATKNDMEDVVRILFHSLMIDISLVTPL